METLEIKENEHFTTEIAEEINDLRNSLINYKEPMTIIYYEHYEHNKNKGYADIISIQLDKNNSFEIEFFLSKGEAKRTKRSVTELNKKYNHNTYNFLPSDRAKYLIELAGLKEHIFVANQQINLQPTLF